MAGGKRSAGETVLSGGQDASLGGRMTNLMTESAVFSQGQRRLEAPRRAEPELPENTRRSQMPNAVGNPAAGGAWNDPEILLLGERAAHELRTSKRWRSRPE